MPAVSVIVPNYNHARFLRRRIENVLCQTYEDFELLLLDAESASFVPLFMQWERTSPNLSALMLEASAGLTPGQVRLSKSHSPTDSSTSSFPAAAGVGRVEAHLHHCKDGS
jgi:hypothetical protein